MRESSRSTGRRTLATAAAGATVTIAVAAVPTLRFAYRNQNAHLVLETAITLIAALVALLLYGRYRRSGALSELLLVYAMTLLSMTALFLVTLPEMLGQDLARAASSWAALTVRVFAGLLVLAAAVVSPDRTHRVAHPSREVAVVALAVIAVSMGVVALAARLPEAVTVTVTPEASGQPSISGHPLVLAAQVADLVSLGIAAVVMTRRAARLGDEMLAWFAAACMLGAWARVNYLLYPSLYTDWLYSGDLLRLGFYLLLLIGALREVTAYWEAQATVAVEAERRRLARDLHDGVIQELGFIRSHVARANRLDTAVEAAADRALAEARRSLSALTEDPDQTLAAALTRVVTEVADQCDQPVRLMLDDAVRVPVTLREELVRIAREAVANAARHSRSPVVWVKLSAGSMTIVDEGRGFDPLRGRPGGFGLTSMRERAEGVGAVLSIRSTPGGGTSVEVRWQAGRG